jgi:predicted TIM-barrel fold metal-dependent hydrolase
MSWAEGAAYRKAGTLRDPDAVYPRVSQEIRDPDGTHLVAAMDIAGVAKSVIMGVDYGPDEWAATRAPVRSIMRRYDEICRASEGRLTYAAGVDPRRPDAAQLAREYLASDVCRGIKFYPPAGFRAYDEVCEPLYQALLETDKVAVFHTAPVRGRLAWRNSWPIYLGDVQARHPGLRIVLAHSGFSCWWDECVALAASHPRTYMELSLWQDEARADRAAFTAMLERAIRLCGSDRILFASDTMYGETLKGADRWGEWVEYFEALPAATDERVSTDDVERMLWRNAEEAFFGVS